MGDKALPGDHGLVRQRSSLSTTHIYRAKPQSALRFRVDLGERGIWIRNRARRPIRTVCCRKRRIAANLNVQVYYDGCYFSCRPGTGCR